MTSTLRPTSSAASSGSRSSFPSAYRYSMKCFFLRHSQARAAVGEMLRPGPIGRTRRTRTEFLSGEFFAGCCASDAKLRVKKMAPRAKTKFLLAIRISSRCKVQNRKSIVPRTSFLRARESRPAILLDTVFQRYDGRCPSAGFPKFTNQCNTFCIRCCNGTTLCTVFA